MAADDRQQDWGERPSRARQPLGPDGFNRRRGIGGRVGPGRQASMRGSDPRSDPNRRGDGGRSRFVAVLVLVVAAVIVIVGGIAATAGDIGSGTGVSISILPFPAETSDTTAQ